jgi:hypothetical membrane protein
MAHTTSRPRPIVVTLGAAALIVAALYYVTAEAVTAASWKNPPYDYAHNFISDLGVPSCGGVLDGRTICSPLHTVMNTGFILQGALFIVAAALLSGLLPGRLRPAYLILAAVHGVGVIIVGLIHGSPESAADGMMHWHGTGAAMAIVCGNAVTLVIGTHLLRSGRARRLGLVEILIGAIGLVSVLVLLTMEGTSPVPFYAAVFERGSVYPITVAELVMGVALLVSPRSRGGTKAVKPTPVSASS